MCREVVCKTCHRPTWAGCGAHVEQVLAHVPPAQRCHCSPAEKNTGGIGSVLKSLFGKR